MLSKYKHKGKQGEEGYILDYIKFNNFCIPKMPKQNKKTILKNFEVNEIEEMLSSINTADKSSFYRNFYC